MAADQEHAHTHAGILGLSGLIIAQDNVLTTMVRRLEAATSRLEDIASSTYPNGEPDAANASNGAQSPGPAAKLASASAAPTIKAPTESLPPAIEAYDEMVNSELKTWLELSSMLGEVIEGQSKAVQQAFAAQRQYIFIANKAKKPDDRTVMELLKDLQASMEKSDEIRQQNRETALKDPLAMVADGVGCLGWITIQPGSSSKPHEHIKELFGGAQMFGNKVLKEYRDKYDYMFQLVDSMGRLTNIKAGEQDFCRLGASLLQAV
jgi:adenylyl cyclase-associated protein